MEPNGSSLIAGDEVRDAQAGWFHAVDPRSGARVEPAFACASGALVDRAARAADRAFASYREVPGASRAAFLDEAAKQLEGVRAALLQRAALETGLRTERLEMEFGRTVRTLRSFAEVVRSGAWSRPLVDPPEAGATPGTIPAHDLRRMLMPLGPVGVFGASNFPLAYGVAGGDTASALAAGCPVIIKGHPSHPGTGEIAARAMNEAVRRSGLDAGVFSCLHSGGEGELEVGAALVAHPAVKAIGFTGSFAGGMALANAAAARAEPIPVFAEMGSTNPIYVLPGALRERGLAIAAQLAASILDSSGQQCTCPGIVFCIDGPEGEAFVAALATALNKQTDNVMLSRRVLRGYRARVGECLAIDGVSCTPALAAFAGARLVEEGPVVAPAGLLRTTLGVLRAATTLREEIFGPGVLVATCADEAELADAPGVASGSLTASVFAAASDEALSRRLLGLVAPRAGRVVFNGVPTGVRVAPAMVHAGPYPATNRPESTAVGALAIERWTRPVCFQNVPTTLLPAELRA
jgi:alpha-ketoglutaric semialdehyde dehydrogenase